MKKEILYSFVSTQKDQQYHKKTENINTDSRKTT